MITQEEFVKHLSFCKNDGGLMFDTPDIDAEDFFLTTYVGEKNQPFSSYQYFYIRLSFTNIVLNSDKEYILSIVISEVKRTLQDFFTFFQEEIKRLKIKDPAFFFNNFLNEQEIVETIIKEILLWKMRRINFS